MSICSVCGEKVPNVAAKIVRGKSGEWVCRECLNKAGIGPIKFSNNFITSDQIQSLINKRCGNTSGGFVVQNVEKENKSNSSQIPTKCPKCGTVYEGNFCPRGCNSPNYQKPKKKKGLKILLIIVAAILAVAVLGNLFGEETPSDTGSTSTPTSTEEKVNPYETEKDLITFEGVEADFVKLYDPKSGVTAFAVCLNLKNNSKEEVTVTLSDGYVNDTSVQFMTGLPVTIASGKKAVGVFMFGYNNLGFSKIEEIEKMEFKISLLSEDWSDLKTSKKVTLNFK